MLPKPARNMPRAVNLLYSTLAWEKENSLHSEAAFSDTRRVADLKAGTAQLVDQAARPMPSFRLLPRVSIMDVAVDMN
jgi:hypothetical protein